MNEVLLGFQLRISPKDLKSWDVSRRATYLLNENITKPLSVDQNIWADSSAEKQYLEIFSNYYTGPNSAPNGLKMYEVKNPSILDSRSDRNGEFLIGTIVIGLG